MSVKMGERMGTLRQLAREEQRTLNELRASGGSKPEAVAASEKRLEAFTRRMTALTSSSNQPTKDFSRRGAEVHLDMTEEELRALHANRAANKKKNPARDVDEAVGNCAVCCMPTTKQVRTKTTSSFLCSPKCEREGWNAHLERSRLDEVAERSRLKKAEAAAREDAEWERQTEERLLTEETDMDYLGIARGACEQTGCAAYVQQRGEPRTLKPTNDDTGHVEVGVWSWNRIDHLSCRRCGAPSSLHEDMTDELRRRRAAATSAKNSDSRRRTPKATSSKGIDSEYYYATRGSSNASYAPRRLEEEESSSDEEVAVLGGSRQQSADLRGAKGGDSYYYAHDPSKVTHRVDSTPQRIVTNELDTLSLKELLQRCKDRAIATDELRASGCLEKSDLVALLKSNSPPPVPPTSS